MVAAPIPNFVQLDDVAKGRVTAVDQDVEAAVDVADPVCATTTERGGVIGAAGAFDSAGCNLCSDKLRALDSLSHVEMRRHHLCVKKESHHREGYVYQPLCSILHCSAATFQRSTLVNPRCQL